MRMDVWQDIGVPVLCTALFGALGLLAGGFLNAFIDSVPDGRPPGPRRFRCRRCRHAPALPDLVPLLGWLLPRFRCRYCGAPLPGRYAVVELVCGVMLGALYLVFGLAPGMAVAALWGFLFTALAVIDVERGLIPNRIIYPSLAAALLVAGLVRGLPWLGGVGLTGGWPQIAIAGLGGGLGFLLFLLAGVAAVLLLGREGLGWGDVKLAALAGLAVGFPLVVPAMMVAAVIGAAAALAARRWAGRATVPFGPALAAGAMAVVLGGKQVLGWMAGF